MSKNSEAVKAWRKRTKERMVDAFGRKCCCCRNEFQDEVFDFHHLDPTEKEFGLGAIRANNIAWKRIVNELKKCVMVCANCHRLIEYGYIYVPDNALMFNDDFTDYRVAFKIDVKKDLCCVCGREKPTTQKNCSRECYIKSQWKADWDNIDLLEMRKIMSKNQIAIKLGVSWATINNKLK